MGDENRPMNVYEGMARVMGAVSAIAKVSSDSVSYKFRSIEDVLNALHGPMSEAGLFMAPRVLDDWQLNPIPGTNNRTQYQAAFRVAVDVWASDGSMVTLGPGLAQSHDYGDKAVYQAQQNAIKYLLLEAFAIPTSEPDMDARTPDDVPVDDATDWLATEVAKFALWTPEQQKQAGVDAAKAIKPGKPINRAEAEAVLAHMKNAYGIDNPSVLPIGE